MPTKILRVLTTILGVLAICAVPAYANRFDHATVTADCTGYTIHVDGGDLFSFALYEVNYTIVLTPTSGPAITVNGSIVVQPDANFNFSATETKAWADVGVVLNGTYTLSGSASLFVNGVFHSEIVFTPVILTCPNCTGAIGDFVWNDLNHNGIQDSGEPGIPNITVQLFNSAMTLLATTTTDVNGIYHFLGLCADTYKVVVPSQPGLSGYTPSPTLQGANTDKDSNPNPYTVVLPSNTTDNSIDFGYFIIPPHLTVTKSPKNGTFTSGSKVSFTIVVGNDGGNPATNVHLDDQLPSNGGLSWTSYTTTQGVCTLSLTNFLHCDLGTINAGGQVTITVSSTDPTPAAACQSQPNPHAIATADGGLQAEDSGGLSCSTGKSLSIGPSSMEGAIKIDNGDWVNGGYSFKFKSNTHIATNFTVSATVSITGPCSNGGTDTVIVPLGTKTYSVPAGNTDWLPTGDANSVLSWQGSVQVGVTSPAICGGTGQLNASKGAVYQATVSQNPPTGSLVDFRFKFRDPAAKGKPNTNCLDTSDPNRAKADVCGASWSQTVTDP